MNRNNIFLAAKPCNYRISDRSKQSISLDSRYLNSFADRVKDISDQCTIVYTDFACHVAPIQLALHDRDVQAVGYYGKMKEGEKAESYCKLKSGEVQVIMFILLESAGAESCFSHLMKMVLICNAQKIVVMFVSKNLAH